MHTECSRKNFGYRSSRSAHSTFTIFWIFNAAGKASLLLPLLLLTVADDEQIPCKVAALREGCQCLCLSSCCHTCLSAMLTLMQCSRCQRVCLLLFHFPAAGAELRGDEEWKGGQLLHSMCAAGSGIISNCVYTFAMQFPLLLQLLLLVPLERLEVCNLPAQHILQSLSLSHSLPLSLSLSAFA